MKRTLRTLIIASLLAAVTNPAWAAGLNEVIDALETPFKTHQIKDYTADFFQESRIASLDRTQRARGEVKVRFEPQRGDRRVPVVMFHWEYQEPTRQEIVSDGKTLWVYLPENNQVIQSDIGLVSQARDNDPMTFLTGLGQLSRDFLIMFASPNRDVAGNYVLELRPRRTTALINRMVIVVDRYAVASDVAADPFSKATTQDTRESRRSAAESGDKASSRSSSFFDEKFDAQQYMKENDQAPASAGSGSAFDEPSGFGSERRRTGGTTFPILSTTVYDPNGNSTIIEFSDVRVNRGISAGEFRFMQPAGVEVVRPTGKEMGF